MPWQSSGYCTAAYAFRQCGSLNRWRAHGCRPRIAQRKSEETWNSAFFSPRIRIPKEEPYPHRDVHARTTDEVIEAERLGYDTAWIAEHHFATSYGIMPDCFAYMAYLAAKTSRIKIGAGRHHPAALRPDPRGREHRLRRHPVQRPRAAGHRLGLPALRVRGAGQGFRQPPRHRRGVGRPDVRCLPSPSLGPQGQVLPGHRPGALRDAAASRYRCRIRRSTWRAAPTARSATAAATASA